MTTNEFRICGLSGVGYVGQTALITRFIQGIFIAGVYEKSMEDTYRKQFDLDGKTVMLEVVNTARYEDLFETPYFTKADGFLVLFSLIDRKSLPKAESMIEQIYKTRDVDVFPIVLVATKEDRKDDYQLTIEEGQTLANKYNIPFFATSAKENLNVNEVFFELTRMLIKQQLGKSLRQKHETEKERKGKCVLM